MMQKNKYEWEAYQLDITKEGKVRIAKEDK
jgi:hypothetical protein